MPSPASNRTDGSGQNQLFGDGHGAWRSYTLAESESINAGGTALVPSIRNGTSYFYR